LAAIYTTQSLMMLILKLYQTGCDYMQRVLSLIIQIQVEEKLIKRDIFIKPHLNTSFLHD